MTSSTSSSRPTSRPTPRQARELRQLGYLAVGVGTLIGLMLVAYATWHHTSLRRYRMDVAELPPPASANHYLAHDARSGHVDHYVLYHGLEGTLEQLHDTDVLILGSSRMMFAFASPSVGRFFRAHGLSYYLLGFGHEEANLLPQRIIERFGLTPRLVIVNADGFFTDTYSPWAGQVMASSRFDALKYTFEADVTHRVRRVLHDVVPNFWELYRDEAEFVVFRSSLDGMWDIEWRRTQTGAFRVPPEPDRVPPLTDRHLRAAVRFRDRVRGWGGRLVLMAVPSPETSMARTAQLASALGVSFVSPTFAEPLRHFDGSHLTGESAQRFSEGFLETLAPLLAVAE